MMITKDRINQYQKAQLQYPEIIIMVRTHRDGLMFSELQNLNQSQKAILNQYFDIKFEYQPHVIFIDPMIERILENKQIRNRPSESQDLTRYLEQLHKVHQTKCYQTYYGYAQSYNHITVEYQTTIKELHLALRTVSDICLKSKETKIFENEK